MQKPLHWTLDTGPGQVVLGTLHVLVHLRPFHLYSRGHYCGHPADEETERRMLLCLAHLPWCSWSWAQVISDCEAVVWTTLPWGCDFTHLSLNRSALTRTAVLGSWLAFCLKIMSALRPCTTVLSHSQSLLTEDWWCVFLEIHLIEPLFKALGVSLNSSASIHEPPILIGGSAEVSWLVRPWGFGLQDPLQSHSHGSLGFPLGFHARLNGRKGLEWIAANLAV